MHHTDLRLDYNGQRFERVPAFLFARTDTEEICHWSDSLATRE